MASGQKTTVSDKKYKAKPLRRVYIPKHGTTKKRPHSIPTMYDRAMQALYALSLSLVAEATADPCSLGFRKYRSAQDACQYAFICLSHKNSAQWVLNGDIKGCYDNIGHVWLLENIPMDKAILKQFLKAGFVYKRHLNPTKHHLSYIGEYDPGRAGGGYRVQILRHKKRDN